LKKGQQVQTPDYLSPINFRYSTLEGLKRYLSDNQKGEKYFYLTNPDAARLCEELENNDIEFELKWVEKSNDPSLISFITKDMEILSSDLYPELTFKVKNKFIHIKELIEEVFD